MRPFQELRVWQAAHAVTLEVYRVTAAFPRDELFGLTSQMRRCSSSIAANIAEGSARASEAEFRHYLNIALGSAAELEYHLILARDLEYLAPDTYAPLDQKVAEVKRMLVAFRKRIGPGAPAPTANSQEPTAQ